MLYARQWCHAPEDALQEALIDILRVEPPPRDLRAWLFKAVRCKAMNIFRAEQRRTKHQQRFASRREAWFSADPEAIFSEVEIQHLLQQLPELEREIVIARVWGELAFEQIADLVNHPLSTVHRRYQRALEQLGKSMNVDLERLKSS